MTRVAAAALGFAFAAILIAACGGSSHIRNRPMLVHLDGHVTGDYVRETSATDVNFLVPTGVLAAQGATRFDIAAPPPEDNGTIQLGPKLAYTSETQMQRAANVWFIGPSITGTTPERARSS